LSVPESGKFFKRHRILSLVLINIVLLVLLDTSVSFFFPQLTYEGLTFGAYQRELTVHRGIRTRSEYFNHGLRPNKAIETTWGHNSYSLMTNSLGFKDREIRQVPRSTDSRRLLFMGDSVTEGLGFDYDDTFSGIVGSFVANEGVEVLNASVSSYSPVIYYAKTKHLLERVGLEFDEIFVFLDISDIQDSVMYTLSPGGQVVKDDMRFSIIASRMIPHEKKRLGMYRVKTTNFLSRSVTLSNLFRFVSLDYQPTSGPRGMWTYYEPYYDLYGKAGLASARHYMDELLNLAREHEIRLTIAVYPWPEQISEDTVDSLQVRFWSEWAAESQVEMINLFPAFMTDYSAEESIARHYVPGDIHLSASGHRLVADSIIEHWVRRNESLPLVR
jgi:hypothetical protein